LIMKTNTSRGGTVLDDAARDLVFGVPGSDWVLAFSKDVVSDAL
jgi:hypothetical protein